MKKHRRNRLKKGWGTVYQIKTKAKDGTIHYREKPWVFRYKGKYIGYYETEEDAMMAAFEYHKNPMEEKEITFKELWELWLEQKSRTISEHTVKNYASKFRTYCGPLYDIPYKDLRPKDFLFVINSRPDTTNGTKNGTIKFLRAMDRFAYELDIIEKKYAENIPMFKADVKRKNIPFTEEEIEYLWNHLDIPDVDIVLILLYTGMRPGELPVVKLENIHEDYIIAGFKTKAGTDRYIPIHPRIKELIMNRVSQAKKDTLLNYQYKQLGVRFRKLMKKLGWVHHLHECRHTFITRLDNAGANRVCINLIVGHVGNGVGERVYTHKTKEQLQETVKLLL